MQACAGGDAPCRLLMAKSDPDGAGRWLPLWMHLTDTAGVMRHLVRHWVPEAVLHAASMHREDFEQAAVFAAATHDIGKASSYFQAVIANPRSAALSGMGLIIRPRDGYQFGTRTPHAHAGQWILQSETTGLGVRPGIAAVVGAHHGQPLATHDPVGEPDLVQAYPVNFYGREGDDQEDAQVQAHWQEAWQRIVAEALGLAGAATTDSLPDLNEEAQVLLSGLLIAADWMASNTDYFPLLPGDDLGGSELYPARIEAGCRSISLPQPWQPGTGHDDVQRFCSRFGFMPNEVQQALIKAVRSCREPGVFILEAQMGVGKTEAALAAAELLAGGTGAGGIFFGLPTQATSNGLFARLRAWAASASEGASHAIRLAHGAAELNEDYAAMMAGGRALVDSAADSSDRGLGVHPWFQGGKRALLAEFVIGTVDQFLMASLRRRHFMLRHLGLAGKVVIIDECHAYDAYMQQYLSRALEWMAAYGVAVILLSATLPAASRAKLAESYARSYVRCRLGQRRPLNERREGWRTAGGYPLLTWTDGRDICQRLIMQEVPRRDIALEFIGAAEQLLARLHEALAGGGCACIILNTVRAAQDMYALTRSGLPGARVILYHAQFTMPDRARKERELLTCMGKGSGEQERHRCVLIGTQVLEQSLDYDADLMISQLCPMDLLLQRMGRLHRHERTRPPRLAQPAFLVLTEEDGQPFGRGTQAVYDSYLLLRTWQCLQPAGSVSLPDDIPRLVEEVYRESGPRETDGEIQESDAGLQQAWHDYRRSQDKKTDSAGHYLLAAPIGRRGSLEDMLGNADATPESAAECRVRDGASSIEVLLLKRQGGGSTFVDEEEAGGQLLSPGQVPEHDLARRIACQRLRLPHSLSAPWNQEQTLKELRERGQQELDAWNSSPWLRDRLMLLLDDDGTAQLGGYRLAYSHETGLSCRREEE